MPRVILATLRPSGNAGDQEDSTYLEDIELNSSGGTVVGNVAIAAQALPDLTGWSAGQVIDAVEVFAKVTVLLSAGAVIDEKELAVNVATPATTFYPIVGAGEWETTGELRLAPMDQQWTAALVNGMTLHVAASATLPPGDSITLRVRELRAEVLALPKVLTGGMAGPAYVQAVA